MDCRPPPAAVPDPAKGSGRTRVTGRSVLSTTRRTFIAGASGLAAYGALAHLTPAPAIAADPPGTTLGEDEFFELSEALTEFGDLDDDAGTAYLANINADPATGAALRDLFVAAGFAGDDAPRTFAEIEASGALDDPEQKAVAEQTLRYWYTGVVDTPNGQVVVTWIEAVGWLVLEDFCEPPASPLGHEKWEDEP
jgi:Membrane bound FAD containing D-sorbitol dehydrogenase